MADDTLLGERLQELVPEPQAAVGWTEVSRRIARGRIRRQVAIGSVGAVLVFAAAFVWMFSEEHRGSVVTNLAGGTSSSTDGAMVGWHVVAENVNLEQVAVRTGELEPASKSWLQHSVVFTNVGDDLIELQPFQKSEFLGDRELLVGWRGCGYGTAPDPTGGILPGLCLGVRVAPQLAPGESFEIPVSVWKGLPGMSEPASAQYVFATDIEYRIVGSDLESQMGTVNLRYAPG